MAHVSNGARAILGICLGLTAVGAVSCHTVSGSGHVITREIPASSFTRIEVSGVFDVTVTTGDQDRVTLTVDDNLVDRLDVGVSGTTLRIGLKSGTTVSNATLKASVTARSLAGVSLSGASKAKLSGQLSALTAEASGASAIDAESLSLQDLTVTLSGASEATVSVDGTIAASLSGASTLRYRGSPTFTRKDVSGASQIEAV